ncbi:MAG: hypothetical protein ACKVRP_03365 [Bacteroidota bacterium]
MRTFLINKRLHVEPFNLDVTENRSPDFKVSSSETGSFFFCEVKSIGTVIDEGGLSFNRVFNIFTAKIHDTIGQFTAVNSAHIVPNVLAFVTSTFQVNSNTFREFLQGCILTTEGQELIADLRKISDNTKNELKTLDLCLFFQGDKVDFFFTGRDKYLRDILIGLFGVERGSLEGIYIT